MERFVIALVIILFASLSGSVGFGQSGRKHLGTPVALPSPVTASTPSSTPTSNADKVAEADEVGGESPGRSAESPALDSLLVAGEVVHPYAYYSSNDIDIALKECVTALRAHRGVRSASKLGKLKYEAAKEEAKKQTDAYMLWISFVAADDGYGNMLIKYADYIVLAPRTAARLTFGRIKPDTLSVVGTGGVLGIPKTVQKSSPALVRLQMRAIVRQIPDVLTHGGWLERL